MDARKELEIRRARSKAAGEMRDMATRRLPGELPPAVAESPSLAGDYLEGPDNPSGKSLSAVLEQLIGEVSARHMRAPNRYGALVITDLESALGWETRRRVMADEIRLERAI